MVGIYLHSNILHLAEDNSVRLKMHSFIVKYGTYACFIAVFACQIPAENVAFTNYLAAP